MTIPAQAVLETPPFVHPTGNLPSCVRIMACGPTYQDYVQTQFFHDPGLPEFDEVWSLNRGLRVFRDADLGFIMDDLVGECRRHVKQMTDYQSLEIPIITSVTDAAVRELMGDAELHRYPLDDVLHHCAIRTLITKGWSKAAIAADFDAIHRLSTHFDYFHNSIPYMLAYAAFVGVQQIYMFGADYTFPGSTVREEDRCNVEFWCGALRAWGIDIVIPKRTTLLSEHKQPHYYGYGARPPLRMRPGRKFVDAQLARFFEPEPEESDREIDFTGHMPVG